MEAVRDVCKAQGLFRGDGFRSVGYYDLDVWGELGERIFNKEGIVNFLVLKTDAGISGFTHFHLYESEEMAKENAKGISKRDGQTVLVLKVIGKFVPPKREDSIWISDSQQ